MTIAREEVDSCIKEMGYITVTPIKLEPSYYKLKDGTVIKALIYINHLTSSPQDPQGFSLNSANLITVFTPKEKRRPELFEPYVPSELQNNIVEDDMEQETLRENFSVYELSNGLVLSIKTVAGQIRKTKYYTQTGEPIYTVSTTPVIKTKKK